ncbi:MAG TPA: thioredoxin domain-containing protein [Alloacidobacterium sp.]|jgi:protein-disulfide isomerase|nr:thioredoxin domain-containing protein [Alloacidobacterium sp.]
MMSRTFLSLAFVSLVGAAGLSLASVSQGQTASQNVLKPPPGAKVALVEFADLECPSCAHENPLLKDAVAKYHIPWARHDFPIQYHHWSSQAAVNARWFDTKSQKLGDDYRDAVFANQMSIETPDDLRTFTDKFAKEHGIAMPFVVDPQGKLADAVKADYELGTRLGVHQTPTVWIVTDKHGVTNATQVSDFSKLYSMLDEAVAETSGAKQARK